MIGSSTRNRTLAIRCPFTIIRNPYQRYLLTFHNDNLLDRQTAWRFVLTRITRYITNRRLLKFSLLKPSRETKLSIKHGDSDNSFAFFFSPRVKYFFNGDRNFNLMRTRSDTFLVASLLGRYDVREEWKKLSVSVCAITVACPTFQSNLVFPMASDWDSIRKDNDIFVPLRILLGAEGTGGDGYAWNLITGTVLFHST